MYLHSCVVIKVIHLTFFSLRQVNEKQTARIKKHYFGLRRNQSFDINSQNKDLTNVKSVKNQITKSFCREMLLRMHFHNMPLIQYSPKMNDKLIHAHVTLLQIKRTRFLTGSSS